MKVLVCVLSVIMILEGYKTKSCFESERDGLLQIKSYFTLISQPQYVPYYLPSWLVGDNKSDCCEWERVKCNPYTGRVTDLFLSGSVFPLRGSWPLNTTLFEPFQELRTLNLSYNYIGSLIHNEVFKPFRELTSLDLSSNWIGLYYYESSLNMAVFQPFHELRTLDLSKNYIGSLVQNKGFSVLKNLEDLNLSYNRLSYLPDFIWNLSSLQVLDLSSCLTPYRELDARVCKLRSIRELYFQSTQLNGNIPSCLWNLTSLQILDLSNNSITGNLPSSINLPSLQFLSIESNYLRGKFSLSSLNNQSSLKVLLLSLNILQVEIEESLRPATFQLQDLDLAFCNLSIQTKTLQKFLFFQSNLQYIDLAGNNLVGSFPTWLLQNNSHLQFLYLGDNLMTGSLQLPQQKNLSLLILDIEYNHFSGKVPYHIGLSLPQLWYLVMSHNSFEGTIPSSLSNMTQLWTIDLSTNNLSGEVPNRVFSHISNLQNLALSNNNLVGEVIPKNMNLSYLRILSLANNHLVGTLIESLKLSTNLMYLDISDNQVTGEIPSWIGNFTYMTSLSVARNHLHGSIPSHICSSWLTRLVFLDLSQNRFTGRIPSCDSPTLCVLLLHENILTGEIPKELTVSTHLQLLDLGNNQLSGGVPTWIYMFSHLRVLLLGYNQLHGEIPIQLCQLQKLNIIDLSNNQISGVIPSCFQNLSFGTLDQVNIDGQFETISVNLVFKDHYFPMNGRYMVFKFDELELIVKSRSDFYKGKILSMISTLDLSCNQLTGNIPPELGELTRLNTLNFSHNRLSGQIPESFSKLKGVESLDLSYNMLSGMIPSELVALNFLEVFNVSYNNLSGKVPETGQFGSFDGSTYKGNSLLCGSRLPKSCTGKEPPSSNSVESSGEEDTSFDLEVFFWSFGMSFMIVLITFGLVLYINPYWRRAWFLFIDLHLLWWIYE